MTLIVGTIRDVTLAGLSGTMTVWSGFRATTTSVVAPRRVVWEVERGALPSGVEVAPGPAIVQLDFGPVAYRSWPVEIPDQPEVTIQELLFQSLLWSPETPLPPPEEVADLLALIARTAEEHRLGLQQDVDQALADIDHAVAAAQQGVLAGQGHVRDAAAHMSAALQYALDALAQANAAENLATRADGAATTAQALRDEAAALKAQIALMRDEIGDTVVHVDGLGQDARDAVDAAVAAAQAAADRAAQAQAVREQIERHLADAQAAVAEGERQVQWALEKAQEAQSAADTAQDYAAQATTIVGDAADLLASTASARDEAQAALAEIAGIGTEVDLIQTQVLNLHDEILTTHGEVLAKHGEAIQAASDAAASAGEAAGLATETATHAANAAQQALEASTANAEAQAAFAAQQEQFNIEYGERADLQAMLLQAVRDAQAAALYERWHILTAHLNGSSSDDYLRIEEGINEAKVTAFGSWVGRVILQAAWINGGSSAVDQRDFTIPLPNGSRTFTLGKIAGSAGRIWARADYTVSPGVQKVHITDRDGFYGGFDGQVSRIPQHDFTAPAGASQYAITFTVGWSNANFLDAFTMRVFHNGTKIGEYDKYNIGPLFGSAYRQRSINIPNVALQAGDNLRFYVGTSGQMVNGYVQDSRVRITYVQS